MSSSPGPPGPPPALGDVFVVAAPSGTGKTTLVSMALAGEWPDPGPPEFSVSHTTRAPRPDEVHGRNYFFVDEAQFEAMVAGGEFLEWAEVHGQLKGTARAEVHDRLAAGADVLLDLDVQGVESVLAVMPDACAILILPPSYAELEHRIVERGHDRPADVARRLAVSLWEIERYPMFDYVIINDDVERASRELKSIIVSRRTLLARNQARVQAIVADFRDALEPVDPPPSADSPDPPHSPPIPRSEIP
ncbi:MAG: guanylate kinase [Acidobacteriota bacterium]|nr:guanylate kinase [Acidobacteriota bacterium]MDH3523375.1 guanylate kinase [Acidobacteriota bacterium]